MQIRVLSDEVVQDDRDVAVERLVVRYAFHTGAFATGPWCISPTYVDVLAPTLVPPDKVGLQFVLAEPSKVRLRVCVVSKRPSVCVSVACTDVCLFSLLLASSISHTHSRVALRALVDDDADGDADVPRGRPSPRSTRGLHSTSTRTCGR